MTIVRPALFALLLSATGHAQDFLSDELSSNPTLVLIEHNHSDSKDTVSDSESQCPGDQNWLFHCPRNGNRSGPARVPFTIRRTQQPAIG
jgi:hypothetical protein